MSDVPRIFGGESAATTEIELLKSRKIIGTAVDDPNLDIIVAPNYFPIIDDAVARSYKGTNNEFSSSLFGFKSYAWGGENIEISEFNVPS
ncbi:MAG: tyrosine-protein kinase Etk/Wzc [Zhongshania sp.]|jgi:tyrosine-protein kinase Etk/Wzc